MRRQLRCDLGNLLIDQGELAIAHRILTTVLDLRRHLADARGEAETAERLARLHRKSGKPHLARKYRHLARRIQQRLGTATTTALAGALPVGAATSTATPETAGWDQRI